MEKEKKNKSKNLTTFQKTAIILIALLCLAIIIQICVIVVLNDKTNDLKDKNEDVTLEQVIETTEDSSHPFFIIIDDNLS